MNSLDFLYIILALGFASLAIFGSMALYNASQLLKDARETVKTTNKIVEAVEASVANVASMSDVLSNLFKGLIKVLHRAVNHGKKEEK